MASNLERLNNAIVKLAWVSRGTRSANAANDLAASWRKWVWDGYARTVSPLALGNVYRPYLDWYAKVRAGLPPELIVKTPRPSAVLPESGWASALDDQRRMTGQGLQAAARAAHDAVRPALPVAGVIFVGAVVLLLAWGYAKRG